MRRKHLLWIAPLVVLGLSACCTTSRAPRPGILKVSPPGAPPLDTSKACANWRWIGIRSPTAAQCPQVPGWRVSPLFAPKLPGQEPYNQQQKPCDQQKNFDEQQTSEKLSGAEAIEELNRFCVYEIADANKELRDVPFPPAVSADLVRFDQDCAAISPTAISPPADRDLSQATWEDVSDYFLRQVGGTPSFTINRQVGGTPPFKIKNQLGVRLAFLDTQPTHVGVPDNPGNSMHGYTLAHIAQHLVCSPETGDCAALITTQLALQYMKFDPRSQTFSKVEPLGGSIGTQSDLANAIVREVKSWQESKAQRRLVLNISVGWDPTFFGGLDVAQRCEMRAGTQAVYLALQYAKSLDVLVLAAAGNQTKCPLPTEGPLLPAAWERGDAPWKSCGKNPNAPLVYAVSGVQSQGKPLFNARYGAMPRRVTYAENAIVPTGDPIQRRNYTGSSVATAVASSIAAVVWDSFPGLKPDELMHILDTSGTELEFSADFWFGAGALPTPQAPKVHRLSLCTALEAAACDGKPGPCPIRSSCDPWVRERVVFPSWGSNQPLETTCDPWLHPQPGDPPCPSPNCPPGG
jgi:Subtilase family